MNEILYARLRSRFSMLESSFTRIATRKLHRFVLKIFKILKLYGFEIKMLYFDNNFEIQQLKNDATYSVKLVIPFAGPF